MNSSIKKASRVRRAKKARGQIKLQCVDRLSVHKSSRHIYAQIISATGEHTLASASTLDESLRSGKTSNKDAAKAVGELLAKRAKEAGVTKVAFDRSGFRYHGRIKALADAAREGGMEF